MDTQYEQEVLEQAVSPVPFTLVFQMGPQSFTVEDFYSEEEILIDQELESAVVLQENVKLKVIFRSSYSAARLYMNALETLVSQGIRIDETEDAYLSPNFGAIDLFAEDYNPLVPGYYYLRVVIGEETWYAPYMVKPKLLSEEQLEVMREQLERKESGLSTEAIVRSHLPTRAQTMPQSRMLSQFMMITSQFPKIMAALSDLYDRVNFRISKGYMQARPEEGHHVDERALRMRLQRPEQRTVMVPTRNLDYNLPENIWIKHMVGRLIHFLNDFLDTFVDYAGEVREEMLELNVFDFKENMRHQLRHKNRLYQEMKTNARLVHRMKVSLQSIASAPWFAEVSSRLPSSVPAVLIRDPRYREIYSLYNRLQEDEMDADCFAEYTYLWKRTDKVYEMWCFIEVLRILESMGFVAERGWVYNDNYDSDTRIFKTIPADEHIVLYKDKWQLHFVYDGTIPLAMNDTEAFSDPLYMCQQHNRPDGRIEAYVDDVYLGSVIMDFKYRPLRNFWHVDKQNSIQRTKEMNQLISYSHSRSRFLYNNKYCASRISPIAEVWAFYPQQDHGSEGSQALPPDEGYVSEDHQVHMYPIKPGTANAHIADELERVLEQMLADYQLFV
jgi:hypothetical protein